MIRKIVRSINGGLQQVFGTRPQQTQRASVGPKSISPEQVQRAVASYYGIKGNNSRIRSLSSVSPASSAWLLETGRDAWYIKLVQQKRDHKQRLKDEVRLYDYLNAHGARAPDVVPATSGLKVVELKIGGRGYYLYLMRKEETRTVSPATVTHRELQTIATALARMHEILKPYPDPYPLPKSSLVSVPPEALADVLVASPNVSEFSQAELDWASALDVRLIAYLNANLATSDLTESLVHGDLSFENFRLLGDDQVYWFDFACRFYGPVVHDLARLIRNLWSREPTNFPRFDQQRYLILSHYQTVHRLPANDWRALAPYIIWYALESSHHYCRIARRSGVPTEIPTIKNQLQLAEYILDAEIWKDYPTAVGA
jgi:Ser/Thr protein kinase RdoA (MazF antagonist)